MQGGWQYKYRAYAVAWTFTRDCLLPPFMLCLPPPPPAPLLLTDYVRLLKYGDSLYRCKELKRAALVRRAGGTGGEEEHGGPEGSRSMGDRRGGRLEGARAAGALAAIAAAAWGCSNSRQPGGPAER